MRTKNLTKYIITLSLGLVLAGAVSVIAIPTTPEGPTEAPGNKATMYTLSDIYTRLDNFSNTATVDNADISTTNTPASLHYSLSDIYGLLDAATSTLVVGNIKDGVSIFGVTGTYTGPELQWSAQVDGQTWAAATLYCSTLTESGATAGEWRMPTRHELTDAITADWAEGTGVIFVDFTVYWSGTEFDATNAWNAYWSGGFLNSYPVVKASTYSVRCVR